MLQQDQELSWAGANIRGFRNGGLGYENVLTAEALTGLDFLPRAAFLGSVLAAAHGGDLGRSCAVKEVEEAEITLLPEEVVLAQSGTSSQDRLIVQPDGIMTSPNSYVLIEAKRIRRSSFKPEQLAREYVALMRDAGTRTPLLLLILGSDPPVSVQGHGRLDLHAAVQLHLRSVLDRAENPGLDESSLVARIADVLAPPTLVAHQVWRLSASQSR